MQSRAVTHRDTGTLTGQATERQRQQLLCSTAVLFVPGAWKAAWLSFSMDVEALLSQTHTNSQCFNVTLQNQLDAKVFDSFVTITLYVDVKS